jgi:hypothetical protein
MSQQLINLGLLPNDGNGDALRVGAQKINENFSELYAAGIPEQAGSNTKFLTTNGTTLRWDRVVDITGNAVTVTNGVYTNGAYSDPAWITSLNPNKVLPTQTGNVGKYLATNGTSVYWATTFSGSYTDLTNKPTIPADVSDLTDTRNLLGGGSALGDLTVVISPGGVDTLQNIAAGNNVRIAATESAEDAGDGSVILSYTPHPDTTAPYITNNSLNVDGLGIVLDAGVNTIRFDSEGLDFDEGFKLPRTQAAEILADSIGIVYTTVAYPRVVKLILKAQLLNDYQACEMMVVRSNSDPVVINDTVYAVIHTSTNPFVTYNAQWDALTNRIEITATNLDVTNSIYVESMVIEVLEWA